KSETVHAQVEPELRDALDLFFHFRVFEIEIRHLRAKQTEVNQLFAVRALRRIPACGASALFRLELVKGTELGHLVAQGGLEPWMPIGSVIERDVEDNTHAPAVGLFYQRLEIFESPVIGINVPVI